MGLNVEKVEIHGHRVLIRPNDSHEMTDFTNGHLELIWSFSFLQTQNTIDYFPNNYFRKQLRTDVLWKVYEESKTEDWSTDQLQREKRFNSAGRIRGGSPGQKAENTTRSKLAGRSRSQGMGKGQVMYISAIERAKQKSEDDANKTNHTDTHSQGKALKLSETKKISRLLHALRMHT